MMMVVVVMVTGDAALALGSEGGEIPGLRGLAKALRESFCPLALVPGAALGDRLELVGDLLRDLLELFGVALR